jgi:hypothetical protein
MGRTTLCCMGSLKFMSAQLDTNGGGLASMSEKDRIRELFQAVAQEHQIRLEVLLNPRSPGWYVDVTCSQRNSDHFAARWESLMTELVSRCGQSGHKVSALKTEAKVERPYATFELHQQ